MILSDYQIEARKTAIYPGKYGIIYPALKLVGEIGEFNEKIYGGKPNEEIVKELGDCLWYCANLCSDLGIRLIQFVGPMEPLFLFCARICEEIGKSFRDGRVVNTEKVSRWIGQIVNEVHELSKTLGVTLEQVMDMNIEKLKSRQNRGVLTGEGDDR